MQKTAPLILILSLTLALLPSLSAPAQARSESRPWYPETADLLQRFTAYAEQAMADWRVPGMAMAVVKGDTVILSRGYGVRETGTGQAVTPQTVFQAGSVTKAFTVALVGQMADRGVLDWNDRVVDRFPAFMVHDPWATREFRIHDLFAQRSGMPSYAGDAQSFIGFDRDHILRSMRHITPESGFRDRFSYVNNLFLAGARVAEIAAKATWETLMDQRIFSPLGMTRSSVDREGYEASPDRATMHVMVKERPVPIRPGSMLFDWPYVYGPAGGLNTCAADMARWLTAQMNHGAYGGSQLFTPATAEHMHTPVTPLILGGLNSAYCQGWMRTELSRTDIIWHNGNTSGGKSFVGFSPALGLGLVVLTNLGDHSLPDALGFQFFDMASGVESPDWSARMLSQEDAANTPEEPDDSPVLPGLPPAAYAGTYASPVYGDLTVRNGKAGLVLTLGPARRTFTARHHSMHTFTACWADISPEDPEFPIRFDTDQDGHVTTLTIPFLDDGNIGTFTRR
jgi:Beta-lactamase class C and other penicillin binding proteins